METTAVSLAPLANILIELAGAALMAFGTWAVARFSQKLKLSSDSETRAYLQQALEQGIDYATGKARAAGKDLSIDIGNELIRDAANYVVDKTPGALKQLKITPEQTQDLVRARLAKLMPPAPAPAAE